MFQDRIQAVAAGRDSATLELVNAADAETVLAVLASAQSKRESTHWKYSHKTKHERAMSDADEDTDAE